MSMEKLATLLVRLFALCLGIYSVRFFASIPLIFLTELNATRHYRGVSSTLERNADFNGSALGFPFQVEDVGALLGTYLIVGIVLFGIAWIIFNLSIYLGTKISQGLD
jgi:hypothetical protein